uniref:Uncharacterized protein n=1 Tax=Pararge aegeria TaxID=116150 RepID=S4P2F7_9NEOP
MPYPPFIFCSYCSLFVLCISLVNIGADSMNTTYSPKLTALKLWLTVAVNLVSQIFPGKIDSKVAIFKITLDLCIYS